MSQNYGWAILDKVGDGTRAERMDWHNWIIIKNEHDEYLIYCQIIFVQKPFNVKSGDTIHFAEYEEKYVPVKRSELTTIKAEELEL